mmetsp:Transcript_34593/g.67727  ORF Transcript_34593/g.67727 Transcript_34593/m.67727 type:complete len:360 (+) Transcript_34593:153-1232(+)
MSSTTAKTTTFAAPTDAGSGDCTSPGDVPALDPTRVATLMSRGVKITAIEPLGANVTGVNFRELDKVSPEVVELLQQEMSRRGFLVFKDQGVLSGDEQVAASELWGGREIHSTHGVHPKAPNDHIFRLSNDRNHGILGVGPQWHNDGSFLPAIFSHVGYHIIKVPEGSGATYFAHQGAAFDRLSPEEQVRWSNFVSVNSNGGVLHPMVHKHPISGRKSIYLHLGMTGAILEVLPEAAEGKQLRLLEENEMQTVFNRYNDLLNAGEKDGYTLAYHYEEGDMVVIDNLAIAHRAAPEAHQSTEQQGLRILHRTTVKGMINFTPPFGLPPVLDIMGRNPLGQGVWEGGGTGFVWKEGIRLQN